MSTNLVKAQTRAVASYAGYSTEEVDVIRRTYGAGCTDDELRLFFYVARETNLSPFRKQLYPVKRWDSKQGREVMAIQTGIDGYRAVASRTGLYEGQETFWCGDDGKWVDVWLSDKPPAAAKCLVYRKGSQKPIVGVARWTAYAQKKKDGSFTPFWLKMPDLMLAKCFSPDTEVLTTHGFQLFSRVTGRVLQVTPEGLEPCDAAPFSQEYDGQMVTLDSDDLNFCVTPNHDMVTTQGKVEAGAMYEAATVRPRYWIPRGVVNRQSGLPVSDETLKLAAAYLADGSDGAASFKVEVSRPAKISFLEELGLHASTGTVRSAGSRAETAYRVITTRANKVRFTYPYTALMGLVAKHKVVNIEALLQLSAEQAFVLLDSWIALDGHTQKKSGVRRIFTSRPGHKTAIELLAVLSGQSISAWKERTSDIGKLPNWCATISHRSDIPVIRWGRIYRGWKSSKRKHTGLELTPNSPGVVWCVTVPSGEIVVRRNGFSMRCGNCAESLALRKAFPEELAGLHTDEEMGQASDFQARREAQQDIAERKLAEMRKAQADGKGAEYLTAPPDAATGEPAPPAAIIDAEFDNPDAEPTPLTDEQIRQTNFRAKMELFALAKQTIGDEAYYRVLGNAGFVHANEVGNFQKMDFLLAEMREIAAEQKARKKRK